MGLQSLLPRGTKTFQVGQYETTIDLALASDVLAAQMLRCEVHDVEHGSDHRAIASVFNDRRRHTVTPATVNYQKTDWYAARQDLRQCCQAVATINSKDDFEKQVKDIVQLVSDVVARHTPKARPSRYAKAWWDDELSALRYEYTTLRNRNIQSLRNGLSQEALSPIVTIARRRFHTAIRDKK